MNPPKNMKIFSHFPVGRQSCFLGYSCKVPSFIFDDMILIGSDWTLAGSGLFLENDSGEARNRIELTFIFEFII